MVIVHLTASFLFGGPERQMLGLAQNLPAPMQSVFVSFSENGNCRPFLEKAQQSGFQAIELDHDFPRLLAAGRDLTGVLRDRQASVLLCHGYKADFVGLQAARRLGIPAVSVSRGWTGDCFRVRLYDALDRRVIRWMEHVVCVSAAQAAKVRGAGVRADKISVIRNAVCMDRFDSPQPEYRDRLRRFFPHPPAKIVGAAGRLSPEKGFDVLIDAAATVVQRDASAGFVLFGEGRLHASLSQAIKLRGLEDQFVLAGFHDDLDQYLPHLDLLALPSFTEGLPNVVLESLAAGVPVVATAVGGTPEVLDDGSSGYLVPPGDAAALAQRILETLADDDRRQAMGRQGQRRVEQDFSFHVQSQSYLQLLQDLSGAPCPA